MRDLEKAKWIWQNRENTPDEYVEFSFCFAMPKNKNAIMALVIIMVCVFFGIIFHNFKHSPFCDQFYLQNPHM